MKQNRKRRGETAEEPAGIVREHKRKAKRTSDETFRGIPVREEVIGLPEEERTCGACGTGLEYIGKELVRKEFRFTRARGEVVEIYRETWKCPSCTSGRTPEKSYEFVKASVPGPLVPHSYASESAVAWTMYQKYANALPLYRQEADWRQMGVPFSRATLANWILFCARGYLKPLYDHFYRRLLQREFLMADETSVQVLKEPERSAQSTSYMWVLRSGEDGLPPILYYRYTRTRAGANAKELLAGFHGYLETDGCQGYSGLEGVKRCCCWAQAGAIVYTVVEMTKLYDLDIYGYLNHVLGHRPKEGMPEEELEKLSPWHPQLKEKLKK